MPTRVISKILSFRHHDRMVTFAEQALDQNKRPAAVKTAHERGVLAGMNDAADRQNDRQACEFNGLAEGGGDGMKDLEGIGRTINELETTAIEIEKIVIGLLRTTNLIQRPDPMGVIFFAPNNQWDELSGQEQQKQRDALRKYQRWYTVAHRYVREYVPERVDEFNLCYSGGTQGRYGVIDYIQLERLQWSRNKSRIIDDFWRIFEIQRSILLSITDLTEIERINVRELISSDFIDREIDEAENLYRLGHHRAAGVLAGVALERHLKMLCDRYGLDYLKEDVVELLVQRLYETDCIDRGQLVTIRHLADIGERCSHPGDITGEEVKESIDRFKELIRQSSPAEPVRPQDQIA